MIELWEMLKYMADIPPRPVGDIIEARFSPSVQNVLISQARKYLEERFAIRIKTKIKLFQT